MYGSLLCQWNINEIFWVFLASITNVLNDSISKTALYQSGLSIVNILFFRFLFSTIRSLPSVIRRPHRYTTPHMGLHMVRGSLFSLAMVAWTYSLIELPLNITTLISLSTPLIIPILAPFFLKEHVDWGRVLLTLGGFMGIVLNMTHTYRHSAKTAHLFMALGAMLLIAALDILSKYLLQRQERISSMMFASSLSSMLALLPFAVYQWKNPTLWEALVLVLFGLGGDLFFYSWLRALSVMPLNVLQPLRNLEFVASCFISYLLFRRCPSLPECISATFILLTAWFMMKNPIAPPNKKDGLVL